MSEITLILIRHGEASQAWGDNLDPGLSIEGMKQSELLTENNKLQSLKDFTFISSPCRASPRHHSRDFASPCFHKAG